VFASVAGTGFAQVNSCSDGSCAFDLRALEEFSVDYNLVSVASLTDGTGFTTNPYPGEPWLLETHLGELGGHGSIYVHARNLQLKTDFHFEIPPGSLETFDYELGLDLFPNPTLSQLEGADIHEELHINGATIPGQASFHLASPLLNICIQIDNLPVPPQASAMVDANLQQAEQMAPMIMQQIGGHFSVDGFPGFGFGAVNPNPYDFVSPVLTGFKGVVSGVFFSDASHPKLLLLIDANLRRVGNYANTVGNNDFGSPVLGVKFSNYANTVGNQFGVRACDVETHSATQSLLASNPEVRDFISNRIAEHQNRLQGLLEPAALNTRFNFIPLEIADRMVAPGGQPCSNELLAVASPKDASIFQILVFGVCSFAMGLAVTYGALRKKSVVSADAYHEVSA